MAIQLEDVPDFVTTCLNEIVKGRYTDLSLLTRYKVAKRLFQKSSKKSWSGSAELEFLAKVDSEQNARVTALFDEDESNVKTMMDKGKVPWSLYTTNFSYDRREPIFQAHDWRMIYDFIQAKDDNMHEQFWELLERHLWEKPTSEAQEPRPLWGIPTWVVKNGAVAGGARNGGNPTGWPNGVGNFNSDDFERWNNWTFAHDGTVTRDGFIKRIVKAMHFCQFKATHPTPNIVNNDKADPYMDPPYGLFTTYRMLEQLGDAKRAQNDDLGPDVAEGYFGATIKGNQVMEVPYLTENYEGPGDGNDPIYGINWDSMGFSKQPGLWMQRNKKMEAAAAHNVCTIHMDSGLASVCFDRSANFVGHRVAA